MAFDDYRLSSYQVDGIVVLVSIPCEPAVTALTRSVRAATAWRETYGRGVLKPRYGVECSVSGDSHPGTVASVLIKGQRPGKQCV